MNPGEQSLLDRTATGLRTSPLLRLITMGALTLVLLLPVDWISSLIHERMNRRTEAIEEVSGKWGRAQTVWGPLLTVPYEHSWIEELPKGKQLKKSERRWLTIVPSDLRIKAQVANEERARGIFSVPVYRLTLDLSGSFVMPDLSPLAIKPESVNWKSAMVAVGLCDTRTIESSGMRWDGRELTFQPGPGNLPEIDSGIHARIEDPFASASPTFTLQLVVNGSGSLNFRPVGQETAVTVTSTWPSPSFQGNWLPTNRTISANGFEATWTIPYLGRNQTPAWTQTEQPLRNLEAATFGVDFVTPVDAHRMSERSVKYAHLFLLLTFASIWLVEVLSGQRVHPIQYLLVGCALCTFYLLELSLSEQIGFSPAYLLAAVAIVAVLGLYAAAVLHGTQRAATVSGTVGALYGYLFVVLTNEDYALLLGSLALFAALAVIMLATRRIDWYAPMSGAIPTNEPVREAS
jgi:inner membrane protein